MQTDDHDKTQIANDIQLRVEPELVPPASPAALPEAAPILNQPRKVEIAYTTRTMDYKPSKLVSTAWNFVYLVIFVAILMFVMVPICASMLSNFIPMQHY